MIETSELGHESRREGRDYLLVRHRPVRLLFQERLPIFPSDSHQKSSRATPPSSARRGDPSCEPISGTESGPPRLRPPAPFANESGIGVPAACCLASLASRGEHPRLFEASPRQQSPTPNVYSVPPWGTVIHHGFSTVNRSSSVASAVTWRTVRLRPRTLTTVSEFTFETNLWVNGCQEAGSSCCSGS